MLRQSIDLVWPRLEGKPPVYEKFLDKETEIDSENLDASIDFAKFMYEKQKDRVSTIESKSSIYLGFFSTVVAILAFALKDILFLAEKGLLHDTILLFGGILVIYILKVMSCAINALERKEYHSFDEGDFLHGDKRKIAVDLINKVKRNYDVINCKVDFMTMAHEFTKRIIWMLSIAAMAIIVSFFYKYISLVPTINFELSSVTFDLRWSDIVLFVLIAILVLYGIRIRKIEKKIEK